MAQAGRTLHMTAPSQTWIYAGISELVRADRLISLYVSDSDPHSRSGETNARGVLWAYVLGHAEPTRINGFIGITAAEILDAMAQALAEAETANLPVAYIAVTETGDRIKQSRVTIHSSLPDASGFA
jgi:hypothetical protein